MKRNWKTTCTHIRKVTYSCLNRKMQHNFYYYYIFFTTWKYYTSITILQNILISNVFLFTMVWFNWLDLKELYNGDWRNSINNYHQSFVPIFVIHIFVISIMQHIISFYLDVHIYLSHFGLNCDGQYYPNTFHSPMLEKTDLRGRVIRKNPFKLFQQIKSEVNQSIRQHLHSMEILW